MRRRRLEPARPEDLAWECPRLEPSGGRPSPGRLIGQERALEALRLGMELYGPGYNIFVSGLTGTRRGVSVAALLREIHAACRPAPDRFYVPNFAEPHRPRLLTLPRGEGEGFMRDLSGLHRILARMLPETLRSQALRRRIEALEAAMRERQQRLFADLVESCRRAGLALVTMQDEAGRVTGQDVFPLVDGEPVPPEALSRAVAEGKIEKAKADALLAAREPLVRRLAESTHRAQKLELELAEQVRGLMRKAAAGVFDSAFAEVSARHPRAASYLEALRSWLLDHLGEVLRWQGGEMPDPPPPALEILVLRRADEDEEPCPVVFEANPTFENLFGTILPGPEGAEPRLCQIRAGSLLRADGGYLVLRLVDVLQSPGVWPMLKRVLKSGLLEIRAFEGSEQGTASPLQPEPIPVQVKVVLIGEPGSYRAMTEEDPEFRKIFKIHAEFDTSMPRTAANLKRYAAFAKALERDEGLLPLSAGGLGRLCEYGVRRAGSKRRLSTRFGELADLLREAGYAARRAGRKRIEREDVLAAEAARRRRMSLPEDRYLDYVKRGVVSVGVRGRRIGEVNGLVIVEIGDFTFGRPSRISARVGAGNRGVVDIERESDLSGPIHVKGVQILTGYLIGTFAREQPLCLSASLCFEQSYSGVDGDSASAAELAALLSALADVPLAQNLALTGAVDQMGRVQAVGGINEKIEGFYRTCRVLGARRNVGVVVPRANRDDVCLAPEVVEAAREGRFSVWFVDEIGEVLEILSGLPAGGPDDPRSFLGRAAAKLTAFARLHKEYGSRGGEA